MGQAAGTGAGDVSVVLRGLLPRSLLLRGLLRRFADRHGISGACLSGACVAPALLAGGLSGGRPVASSLGARLGGRGGLDLLANDVAGVLAEVEADLFLAGRLLAGEAAFAGGPGGIEKRHALRRLLATLAGELRRGLDRLAAGLLREAQVLAGEDVLGLARLDAGKGALQIGAAQRLLLQKLLGHAVEVVAVLGQNFVGLLVRRVEQVLQLLVDLRRNLLGVLDGTAATHVRERVALLLAELHGTQLRGEAVLGEHGARDLGGVFDVGGRARGRGTEDEFFGGAPAHGEDEAGEHLVAGVETLVVFLGGHRVPAGAAAGQDCHLVHTLNVLERPRGERVTALVVGGDLLFVLGDDLGLAARAAHHAVGGLLERVRGDHVAADAGGEQRGLVEHVGQIRAGHAGGALG